VFVGTRRIVIVVCCRIVVVVVFVVFITTFSAGFWTVKRHISIIFGIAFAERFPDGTRWMHVFTFVSFRSWSVSTGHGTMLLHVMGIPIAFSLFFPGSTVIEKSSRL
jgi:hypothetical protein